MNKDATTGVYDRDLINTGENYEVEYWANKFGVRPEELKSAVRCVGNSAFEVGKYLKKTTWIK